MSKTDKTRPWHVRALDDPTYLAPEHDHRDGTCDLPEQPVWGWGTGTRCRWEPTAAFWADPANRCGCRLCSDQAGRRARARRDRRDARSYARGGWRRDW